MKSICWLIVGTILGSSFSCPVASGQTKTYLACDPRLGLAKMAPIGFTKSRWQDAIDPEGQPDLVQVKEVQKVLRFGTRAVPMLIACLADEEKTRTPIWDFWPETKVDNIAFSILSDLFTDPTRKHTLKAAIYWSDVQAGSPESPAWIAWDRYVAKHGRAYIQQAWLRAWAKNRSRIYWDNSLRCFRIRN